MTVAAYRSSLVETGKYGLDACPALGEELKHGLEELNEKLSSTVTLRGGEGTQRAAFRSSCRIGAGARPSITGNRPAR